ncbi:hypothetical protein [Candidatus Avelusimicrobium luingense]|uniref:hypothetical protein n=1 Tax=Candidatus Avelusimicrobium luingense TaxID=3416211 RepID=UPI003D0CD7E5
MKTEKEVFEDLKVLKKSARLAQARLQKLVYTMPFFSYAPVEALQALNIYCLRLENSEQELKQLAQENTKKPKA